MTTDNPKGDVQDPSEPKRVDTEVETSAQPEPADAVENAPAQPDVNVDVSVDTPSDN